MCEHDESPVIEYIRSARGMRIYNSTLAKWILRAHNLGSKQRLELLGHHWHLHHAIIGIQIVLSMGFEDF
jgi:hypothetical protein